MAIPATQIKNGMVLLHNDKPHKVVTKQHVTPGKGNAVVQAQVQNLETGAIFQIRFRSAEQVEPVRLESTELQFSYQQGEDYVFMNTKTYDQLEMSEDQLGDAKNYLVENMEVQVQIWSGKPISVEVPNFVELEITQCDPGVRGDTVSGATKPATMSTGYVVQVPLFVEQGETIRIDTRTGEYMDRVKK